MRSDGSPRSFLAWQKVLNSQTSAHQEVNVALNFQDYHDRGQTHSHISSALPHSVPEVQSLKANATNKVYFKV